MIGWQWLLHNLPKKIGGFAYAILVGCIANYVYEHSLKPLQAAPVPSPGRDISIPVGPILGPPKDTTLPPPPSPPPPPPPPPGVIALPGGKADVYHHLCKLSDGQSFNFSVVVFSDAYSWVWNKNDQIELNEERALEGRDFIDLIQRSADLRNILNKASGIVVAGTASCDGSDAEYNGSDPEDARALGRSGMLKRWVQSAILPMNPDGPPRRVHTLNLGRYWPDTKSGQSCDSHHENTAHQRQVILMAIAESASPRSLDVCIKQDLMDDEQLSPLLSHYHRFDLNKGLHGEPL